MCANHRFYVQWQHIDANCEKEKPCTSSVLGLFLLPSKFKDELEVLLLPTALDWSFVASSFPITQIRYQNFHLTGVTNCIPISTRAKINDTIRLFIARGKEKKSYNHL